MAELKRFFKCPTCKCRYSALDKAVKCRNNHEIREELWAISKSGKGVRVSPNSAPNGLYGMEWALREADLSDDINERRQQLEQERMREKKMEGERKRCF